MVNKIKKYIFELVLNTIYISGIIYFILNNKNLMGMGLSVVCIVSSTILFFLKKRKLILSNSLYYVCNLFMLFSSLLGSGFRFYSIPHYDDFLHIWSGIIGISVAHNFYKLFIKDDIKLNPIFLLIYLFMFSMGVSALWEMMEYLLDTFLGMKTQVGGIEDTMIDIIDCFVGSVIMLIYYSQSIYKHYKIKKD